jgi:alpha-galactosidase
VARPWEKYNLYLYDWNRASVERDKNWRTITAMVRGGLPVDDLQDVDSEGAVEIIEGLLDHKGYHSAVNIPNRGYIPNLPDGAIVELPASFTGGGIQGLHLDPLPEMVAELCRREISVAGLSVDAAVTGDRQTALQALLLDPCLNDMDTARAILDACLSEYAAYLPRFD